MFVLDRVFSDGGNFCPDEIDEYRKKLEKMSHKIDSAEGFIMADLEGMESKRLDQAMKVSSEFEDRSVIGRHFLKPSIHFNKSQC